MNFYIARDGAEIGEYPRAELEKRARAGTLHPSDYYWREGMETWLTLNDLLGPEVWKKDAAPARPPVARSRKFFGAATLLTILIALVLSAVYVVRRAKMPSSAGGPLFVAPSTPASPAPVDPEVVQNKAVADLKEMLNRLPRQPAPPLHIFYYGVSINMQKTISERAPWRAVISGSENAVDSETDQTVEHIEFILTINYQDGAWTFAHYRATAVNMRTSVTTEIEDDEKTPAPPSIVGVMGLK